VPKSNTLRGVRLIAVQMMVCVLAGTVALFAPPTSGEMLLLPVTPSAAGHLPAIATIDGMRLIGRGPVKGSLLVRGNGLRLAAYLVGQGIVPLAAGRSGCGSSA
jgi:hypothetical protein